MANLYLVAMRETDETGKRGYTATYVLADSIEQILLSDPKEVRDQFKDRVSSIQLLASDTDKTNPCHFYDARNDKPDDEVRPEVVQ